MNKKTSNKKSEKAATATPETKKAVKVAFAFNKENYKWLIIGVLIIFVGFLLMVGGGSDDPTVFTGEKLFSPLRLTISPLMILAGYVVVLYAILKNPKTKPEA
jgi:hypothetical protein